MNSSKTAMALLNTGMITTFHEWVKLREADLQQQQQFDPKQIQVKPVRWVMPNIMKESGEITRQASALGMKWQELMQAVRQARLVQLDEQTWQNMQNTNSNDPSLSWQKVTTWKHRDWRRIVQAFQEGGTLPAPIVLVHDGTPYCLAGNTRLTICRLLRVKPQVLMVQA